MTLKLTMPEITEMKPRILVAGVGGAGGNAVNNMMRSDLQGVEFLVANTDAQSLANSLCDTRVQLGISLTEGLGAGARPEIGAAAAQEALEHLHEHISGAHMAFITAGMGGGTGTGAAPVIAKLARDQGILTIGVVTKPFQFEGTRRMAIADEGIEELQKYVDTLIVIPNQNLFRVANEKTTFADAFTMADNVLNSGVRGITDLMVMPGLINLDFADVRTVMMEMGKAMMGTGEAEGESRAVEAAELAISNPLLDDVSLNGAHGVLINITGGTDLTLFEVDEAANRIRTEVDSDANIIVGSTFSDDLDGKMRVSVFATGIEVAEMQQAQPSTPISMFERNRPGVPGRSEPVVEKRPVRVLDQREAFQASKGPDPKPETVAPVKPVFEPAAPTLPVQTKEAAAPAPAPMVKKVMERTAVAPQSAVRPKSIDEPFIAPKPMTPEHIAPQRADAKPRRAEAFAEAAMTNGPGKQETARIPSLLERVTGRTRAKGQKQPMENAAAPTPKAPEKTESRPALETPDDVHPSPIVDDPIDIPAFLRRQAN